MSEPTSSDVSWLQLLHDDAPRSSLEARHLADARERSAPETLRAGALTLQIHDRLAGLARQGREFSALNTVARRLASVQGMDSVLREVVAQSRQLLGVDVTYLMLRDPEGDLLRIEVVDGSLGSALRGIQLGPGEGLGGEVLRTGQPLWVESYVDAPNLHHVSSVDAAALSEHLGGILGLPLRAGDEVLGVLIAADRRRRQFTPAEVELLAGLAAHAAVAVRNARMFEDLECALASVRHANARLEQTLEQRSREASLREALSEAVVTGADALHLCRLLGRAVGTPVHLVANYTPGARATLVGQDGDRIPPSALEALAELADDPRPTCRTLRPGADIDGGLDALVEGTFAPVMLRDGCAGWLVLVTSAPPPPEHIALLSIGAASVAVVLAHERTMSQIELHASRELLHALLDVGSDVETIRRRAAGAGVNLRSVNAVMVIRSPDRASLPSRHPGLLTLARDTGSWLGDHDDEIVLLARGVSVEAIEERLRRLVPDFESATAGIAVCTGGVEATREAYVSARQTALVLQALERDGAVVRGGELGIYQGLLSHAGRGDLREFVDATIGNLVRGDEERGRDLTRTVACYIANAQHHARTCADLHIHANTLYARLGRINDLMGPTWREPDRLLEIQLALRMRDLDTRIETGPHVRERMRELDPDD